MVDHWVQNSQVPYHWNCVWLLHWPRDQEVWAMDQDGSQIWVGPWASTTGQFFMIFINKDLKSSFINFPHWKNKVWNDLWCQDLYCLQAALVHTSETTRIKYFLDMLIDKRRPVMLVGTAGTGKTVLMGDKMNGLSEDFMVANIPFNFYTTSEMLQRTLEKPLEKKAGRNFGPPGTRRLIYFVDDMNMPEVKSTSDFSCYL